MKKTAVIIQARMGSSRLPGKVLKPILGKPMLERQIERVKRAKLVDQIIIATTTKHKDDPVVKLTKKLNVDSYRGSETDVLDRFYQAANKYHADAVVRLTGDCPLIDPQVIDAVVTAFNQGDYDYASNRTLSFTFPSGMDVEVFTFSVLKKIHKKAQAAYDREHVTPYIYHHPRLFKLKKVEAKNNLQRPDLHLSVDRQEDLKLVRKIYAYLYPKNSQFSFQDILQLFKEKPQSFNASL